MALYILILLAYGAVFMLNTSSIAAFNIAIGWGAFFFSNQLFWMWLEKKYPYRIADDTIPTERVRINFILLAAKEAFVGALLPVGLMALAAQSTKNDYGVMNLLQAPAWLNIIVGILLFDFIAYTVHVAMHRHKWLRKIHAVHHSDLWLDASSVLRLHPLESLLRAVVYVGIVVLMGLSPMAILAANGLRVVAAAWHHSAVYTPTWLEKYGAWWLNTPAMHRLHHANDAHHSNQNFGQIFSVWDFLYRTAQPSPAHDKQLTTITYGVPFTPHMPQTLWGLLRWPFI